MKHFIFYTIISISSVFSFSGEITIKPSIAEGKIEIRDQNKIYIDGKLTCKIGENIGPCENPLDEDNSHFYFEKLRGVYKIKNKLSCGKMEGKSFKMKGCNEKELTFFEIKESNTNTNTNYNKNKDKKETIKQYGFSEIDKEEKSDDKKYKDLKQYEIKPDIINQDEARLDIINPFEVKPNTINPFEAQPDVLKQDGIKPDTTKPYEAKPDISKPYDTKLDTIKPNISKPDTIKPDIIKQDEKKLDETKPDEKKSNGILKDEINLDQANLDEKKSNETKPDETKPDDAKTDEKKTDEKKTDDTKTDEKKPDDTKPDEKKPDEKNEIHKFLGFNFSKDTNSNSLLPLNNSLLENDQNQDDYSYSLFGNSFKNKNDPENKNNSETSDTKEVEKSEEENSKKGVVSKIKETIKKISPLKEVDVKNNLLGGENNDSNFLGNSASYLKGSNLLGNSCIGPDYCNSNQLPNQNICDINNPNCLQPNNITPQTSDFTKNLFNLNYKYNETNNGSCNTGAENINQGNITNENDVKNVLNCSAGQQECLNTNMHFNIDSAEQSLKGSLQTYPLNQTLENQNVNSQTSSFSSYDQGLNTQNINNLTLNATQKPVCHKGLTCKVNYENCNQDPNSNNNLTPNINCVQGQKERLNALYNTTSSNGITSGTTPASTIKNQNMNVQISPMNPQSPNNCANIINPNPLIPASPNQTLISPNFIQTPEPLSTAPSVGFNTLYFDQKENDATKDTKIDPAEEISKILKYKQPIETGNSNLCQEDQKIIIDNLLSNYNHNEIEPLKGGVYKLIVPSSCSTQKPLGNSYCRCISAKCTAGQCIPIASPVLNDFENQKSIFKQSIKACNQKIFQLKIKYEHLMGKLCGEKEKNKSLHEAIDIIKVFKTKDSDFNGKTMGSDTIDEIADINLGQKTNTKDFKKDVELKNNLNDKNKLSNNLLSKKSIFSNLVETNKKLKNNEKEKVKVNSSTDIEVRKLEEKIKMLRKKKAEKEKLLKKNNKDIELDPYSEKEPEIISGRFVKKIIDDVNKLKKINTQTIKLSNNELVEIPGDSKLVTKFV